MACDGGDVNTAEAKARLSRGSGSEGWLAAVAVVCSAALFFALVHRPFFGTRIPKRLAQLGNLGTALNYVYGNVLSLFALAVPFVVIELRSRRKRGGVRRRYLFPTAIWLIYFILSCSVMFIATRIQGALKIVPVTERMHLSYGLQVVLWIIVSDFGIYWEHRLEHRSTVLWKLHSTHHSITDLNSINQYTHWFEGIIRFVGVTLPVSVFVATPVLTQSAIALIYSTWAVYEHSDAPELQLPRHFRLVLADNSYHHYHHAVEERFHNRNFGHLFSVWDRMYGTQVMPERGNEFPATGLSDLRAPVTAFEYACHPFLPQLKVDSDRDMPSKIR
jgi:sterol desaturase/sphingolipid hydroxylase (fatty acid hydroxylase superfamily)